MLDIIKEAFGSVTISDYILKISISICATLITSFIGTLFGKIIVKMKESKQVNYICTLVRAAEKKYPNLGAKTGKEKFQYVMEQIALKYPKLVSNEYTKNMVEAAVYTITNETKKEVKYKKKQLKKMLKEEKKEGTRKHKTNVSSN